MSELSNPEHSYYSRPEFVAAVRRALAVYEWLKRRALWIALEEGSRS